MDQGGEGGKYHLEEYKGKDPGLYETEFGTVRVGKDGKITYHKKGSEVPPVETPAPVSEADDEDKGDTRISPTGIKQTGMTLGGIKDFNAAYGLEVADASKLFDLSTPTRKDAYKGEDNKISTGKTGYTVPKASAPIVGADTVKGGDLKIDTGKSGGYTIPPASVPGTTNHTGADPQEGISSAPDEADNSRGLSFSTGKRGARQQEFANRPGNRAFGGEEPSDSSLVSPMYKDKARNAYRSGFLDSTAKGPMGVLRDASAAQGVIRTNDGKIAMKNGDSYMTYTGDKSAREVAFDLGGGQKGYDKHRDHFESLGVPDKPEVKPDDEQTPATVQPEWKDMTMDQKKGAVTAYAQDFVNTFKDKLKDKK